MGDGGPAVRLRLEHPLCVDPPPDLNVTYASHCSAYRALPSDLELIISSPSDGTPPATPTVTSPSPKRVITTKEFTVTGNGEPLTHVEIRNSAGEVTGTTDVGPDGIWAYTFTAHELEPYYTGRRTPFTFAVAAYDDAVNYSQAASYTYTLKIAP